MRESRPLLAIMFVESPERRHEGASELPALQCSPELHHKYVQLEQLWHRGPNRTCVSIIWPPTADDDKRISMSGQA